jgi:hypothetical protein
VNTPYFSCRELADPLVYILPYSRWFFNPHGRDSQKSWMAFTERQKQGRAMMALRLPWPHFRDSKPRSLLTETANVVK